MALTLPTNVVAGNTGHITHTNILHQLSNGFIFNTTDFWIPATSVSDATAGRLMRASARAAASGVASLDANTKVPVAQMPTAVVRTDQQTSITPLTGLKLGAFNNSLPSAIVNLQASRGTATVPVALSSGDYLGGISASGQFDTTVGDYGGAAVIRFKATENFAGSAGTATNAGTKIEMVVNDNAVGTTALIAVTIDHDASVALAGTLAVAGASVFTGSVTAPNVMQTDGVRNAVTGSGGLIDNTSASGVLFNGIRNTGALTATGTQLLSLRGQGATDGANTIATGGSITFKADAAFSAGSSPGRIEFATTPTGSTTQVVRAAITQAGIFFIGTTVLSATWAVDQSGNTTWGEASNLVFGTTTGTKIGTSASQKLSFFNATPIVQYATTGTSTGFTAGGGTTATSTSTFTGNTGSTAYTTGDVVRGLKLLGLFAA